jgi:RNA polymerase sigma-70 factor (ECF subfamily)
VKDEELIKKIHLGDEKATEELINRYYVSILRYCKSHCSDLAKAEDLTQETFLRVFKTLSKYKEKGCFKAYIYTIANHLCVDESRKVRLYPLENEEELVYGNDEMLQVENKAEIDYLLSVLSPEQREAVILHFGEQLSFEEIAKVTDCNMRTVQSRVRNALKIMRKERGYER